ncbi:MAG: molybdopterin cofactor-binding domain-containing protein, partial [Actinomycetota bacterium]
MAIGSGIPERDRLPLFVDGDEYTIAARDLSSAHTLAGFLRDHVGKAGREACGEGGCGACSVIITRPVVDADGALCLDSYSVAACVTPVGDVAFASVTTPHDHGPGGEDDITPAQEALIATNAAQCGFCTGGIVSVLDSTCSGRGRSTADVESLLDGNLCRCTGYRSISEAAQMLCDDYDGEHAEAAVEIRARAREYRTRMDDPGSFPAPLLEAFERYFRTSGVDGVALVERSQGLDADLDPDRPGLDGDLLYSHVRPASLDALAAAYAARADGATLAAAGGSSRWEERHLLAAGFTDVAYDEDDAGRQVHHTISVRDVPELRHWEIRDDGRLAIGAAISIGALAQIEADLATMQGGDAHLASLRALTTQARYFANENVRHTGSVGGGLVSCHHLSDMVPVWVALDAEVEVVSHEAGRRSEPVRTLIDVVAGRLDLAPDEIVAAIVVPPRPPGSFVAETFKQAIRRTDSMALVSAAMTAELTADLELRNVCLAFGGLGAPGLRASATEAVLDGFWLADDIEPILAVLADEIEEINVRPLPTDMRAYQRRVAAGFLRRFVHMAAPGRRRAEDVDRLDQPPIRGRQHFGEERVSEAIVGRAVGHRYLPQHVRGDTRYTVDEWLPEEGLHAAVVPAPIARGRLIRLDDAACDGDRDYVGLVTAADVPGSNLQGHMVHPLAEEEILVSERITHVGQPVALALGRTRSAAETAARRVAVIAEADPEPPVLTFDDIEATDSWFSFEHAEDPADEPRERNLRRGDPAAAFAAAAADPERYAVLDGQVDVGGQSCFYLEPQCAVARPEASGAMRIVSSTQSPAHVARYVASALGVPEHRVDVDAGFVGGGFGGKQTRSASFAAMAAIAARVTDRPVKLELSRAADMTLGPGRSPFRARYRLALERSTGLISAIDVDMITNRGAGEDYSPSIAETSVFLIDNAYHLEHASIRARCGRSNLPAGFTATRGYGKPQTGAIIESILDEAAHHIGLDPQEVRRRNLYRKGQAALAETPIDDDVLEACWDQAVSVRYDAWRADGESFNESHSLVKRGIAAVPSKGNMGFLEAADINRGAAVVRIHADGSVRVSHSGVEMGQGINTRMVQVTAQALGIDPDRIVIDTTRTTDLPNTPPTTMVATDMIGASILNACDELLATLGTQGYEPGAGDFDAAVAGAYEAGLPLQAWGEAQEPRLRFDWERQQGDVSYFFVWGAALSEVEVDAGTGSWRILRTHITQDCGRSLNPLLDVGQVEGGFAFGLGYALLEKMI